MVEIVVAAAPGAVQAVDDALVEDAHDDLVATVEAQVDMVDAVEDVDALVLVPAIILVSRSSPRPSTMMVALELFFRRFMLMLCFDLSTTMQLQCKCKVDNLITTRSLKMKN